MKPTGGSVAAIIAATAPAIRRRDAEALTSMMQEISGREPAAWGSIIGFGTCRYRYPTGNEGDAPLLGFAPRKAATTIYLLDGADAHSDDLARLGPHSRGAGCLHLKDLDQVADAVLRGILKRSLAWAEAGGTQEMLIDVRD